MTQNIVYIRASFDDIRGRISNLVSDAKSRRRENDAIMTRCGTTALGYIREAFVVKSRGGTDETGLKWTPLSPKTIAYSKTRMRGRGGRTKTERKRATMPSQALNPIQQDKWWQVYRQQLAIHKGDKGHAAAVAWLILKGMGARTLVDKYGNRQVEILRDTGLLLNSLSPGVASPNQIFRVGPGYVIMGTNRKGAKAHHEGTGNVPQRKLWPDPDKWPRKWWADIVEQAKIGLLEFATTMTQERR